MAALMQMVKSFLVNRRMMIDEIIKYLVAIAYMQFPIPIFQLWWNESVLARSIAIYNVL